MQTIKAEQLQAAEPSCKAITRNQEEGFYKSEDDEWSGITIAL